jgi:hypothetical protein
MGALFSLAIPNAQEGSPAEKGGTAMISAAAGVMVKYPLHGVFTVMCLLRH